MSYLENSPSLNPLKYKASVKMADAPFLKGVIGLLCSVVSQIYNR